MPMYRTMDRRTKILAVIDNDHTRWNAFSIDVTWPGIYTILHSPCTGSSCTCAHGRQQVVTPASADMCRLMVKMLYAEQNGNIGLSNMLTSDHTLMTYGDLVDLRFADRSDVWRKHPKENAVHRNRYNLNGCNCPWRKKSNPKSVETVP